MKKKEDRTDSAEPYVYIALVLKGTEKQYLNLLKYVNNRNGSQVIYQCKSLTYLRVTRDGETHPKNRKMPNLELAVPEAVEVEEK
jgi:hypothetical protein